jgi:hypothetical protein
MKRSENLVISGWLLGAVVLVMVLAMGTWVEATTMSFREYGYFSPAQDLWMANGDNLLIRVDGVDKSIVDAGYGAGFWHLGLTNSDGYVVGWAKNSFKSSGGYEGWLGGEYSGSAPLYDKGVLVYKGLANGEKPTHLFLVYDKLNNGWGSSGSQLGTPQDLLEGDLFLDEEDILFGPDRLLGDVSLLPMYGADVIAILPKMTVVILPLASDFNYLLILCEYWLRDDCSALNNHCGGADDWKPDGKVNFLDFAELASRW